MSPLQSLRAVASYGWLTFRLNFRSRQTIAYGYLMPVFFLIAFASLFRGGTPPLFNEFGQLLTITSLGTASIGLPTALVGERERGVWRRLRLLPVSSHALLGGVLVARLAIVASATLLQVLLARLLYGTPFPAHPAAILLALVVTSFAFLGIGLVIATLADEVPAVQALGQCVFLPMIIVGGVGVPLAVLPDWAQRISGFMPGRYAVDVLQRCYSEPEGLHGAGFSLAALVVIGAAAFAVGVRYFRWDVHGRRNATGSRAAVVVTLIAWLSVGAAALALGKLEPVGSNAAGYTSLTDADLDRISVRDLPGDQEFVTRLAPPFKSAADAEAMRGFVAKLQAWPPATVHDPVQLTRNLLSAAGIADAGVDPHEAEIARTIFMELESRFDPADLRRILGWVILHPDGGSVVTAAPELGFRRTVREDVIRQRVTLYAKKLLGRQLGKIRD